MAFARSEDQAVQIAAIYTNILLFLVEMWFTNAWLLLTAGCNVQLVYLSNMKQSLQKSKRKQNAFPPFVNSENINNIFKK